MSTITNPFWFGQQVLSGAKAIGQLCQIAFELDRAIRQEIKCPGQTCMVSDDVIKALVNVCDSVIIDIPLAFSAMAKFALERVENHDVELVRRLERQLKRAD